MTGTRRCRALYVEKNGSVVLCSRYHPHVPSTEHSGRAPGGGRVTWYDSTPGAAPDNEDNSIQALATRTAAVATYVEQAVAASNKRERELLARDRAARPSPFMQPAPPPKPWWTRIPTGGEGLLTVSATLMVVGGTASAIAAAGMGHWWTGFVGISRAWVVLTLLISRHNAKAAAAAVPSPAPKPTAPPQEEGPMLIRVLLDTLPPEFAARIEVENIDRAERGVPPIEVVFGPEARGDA